MNGQLNFNTLIAALLFVIAESASGQTLSNGSAELPFGVFVPQVDLASKDEVAILYYHNNYAPGYFDTNGAYVVPRNFPIAANWTGSIQNCDPGTNSGGFRTAGVRQINYKRSLAGLASVAMGDAQAHLEAQAGALITGANASLTHYPPPGSKCYSALTALGASRSNMGLSLGTPSDPTYIGTFITDGGDWNWEVGHRRELLYPRRSAFSFGTVTYTDPNFPSSLSGVKAVRTPDGDFSWPTGTMDPLEIVAWPPPGWVPHLELPAGSNRWSFSCALCGFKGTTIEMKKDGVPMATPSIEQLSGDLDDFNREGAINNPTIVFNPVGVDYGIDYSRWQYGDLVHLAKEAVYDVTIRNVRVYASCGPHTHPPCGFPPTLRTFSYQVKVFDVQKHFASKAFAKFIVNDTWNAGDAGWGFQLQFANDGKLMATWHTFDASGNPLWAVIPALRWQSPTVAVGNVYTSTSSPLGTNFDPSSLTLAVEGRATLSFSDEKNANVVAKLRGSTLSTSLRRFPSNPADTEYSDGSNFNGVWKSVSDPGTLVALSHRYQTIAVSFLTHDAKQNPVWYAMEGCKFDIVSRTCVGNLMMRTASGSPQLGTFVQSSVSATVVGTLKLTFRDDYTATLDLTLNGTPIAQTITRQLYAENLIGRALAPAANGGVDIEGTGKGEIPLRSASAESMIGRLVGSQLQFSSLADPGPNYRLLGAGDFRGVGASDLAFLNINQGTFGDVKSWAGFSSSAETVWRQVKPAWVVQAIGDLDGDGYSDLVWRWTGGEGNTNDVGVSYVWFTNGTGVSQVRKRGGAPLSWTLLGAADIDGDGAADMVYVSPQSAIKVLMATPDRTCANVAAGSVPSGFSALKIADFTGAKHGDILTMNTSTGEVSVLMLSASGINLPSYGGAPDDPNAACTPTTQTIGQTVKVLPTVPTSWRLWAVADLNGDGIVDIVWRQSDGTLTGWLMNAGTRSPTVLPILGVAPIDFNVIQP